MPEGSLTLRVKVLGIEGLRSIPLDLEVSAGETRLVTRTLAGVSPRRQMVAFRRQLERDSLADSPREVLVGGPAAE